MPDDQSPPLGAVGDPDAQIDPALVAAVQRALGELDFLRPDGSGADEPMPDWAWARITSALDAERGAPAPGRRWVRWTGGLAAASVAVLAIGVAVTTFSGGSGGGDVVMAEAPADVSQLAEAPADASQLAEAPAAAQPFAARAVPAEDLAPTRLSFAGMVPPAMTVMDSHTDYTSPSLRSQVANVLKGMGMGEPTMQAALADPPAEVSVPAEVDGQVLLSPRSLRDCITKLTEVATSTALLIDWARVDGADAGVVVAPDYVGPEQSTPDLTELDIWVIDPECDILATLHMQMP